MYAKYTGFFRTRRENHNLIKFSPFWKRYYLIKFSPFWGRIFYVIAKHRIAVLWQSPGREPYYKPTQDIFVPEGKRRTQAKE